MSEYVPANQAHLDPEISQTHPTEASIRYACANQDKNGWAEHRVVGIIRGQKFINRNHFRKAIQAAFESAA